MSKFGLIAPVLIAAGLAGEPDLSEAAPPKRDQGEKIDPVKGLCFDPVMNARMYFGVALIHAGNAAQGSQKNRELQCREARRHFDFAQTEIDRSHKCCPQKEKNGNKDLLDKARQAFAARAKAEAMIKRNCPRSI